MKTRNLLLIFLVVAAMAHSQTLTQPERDRAVNHLQSTRQAFLDSLAGITPAQWNFKPGPDRWSIAECAEHITVSEEALYELVTAKIMKAPAAPEKKAETAGNDDKILALVADRSQKAQAPEFLRPSGRWTTQAAMAEHFGKSRERLIGYMRATAEDLRSHSAPHPLLKALDAYQWVLLISAHSGRHTAQINEVKAHPDFPKAGGASAPSGKKGHYLVMLKRQGSTSLKDLTPRDRQAFQEHVAYLQGLLKENKLVFGGPRQDGVFGLVVYETSTREEAESLAANDPGVKAGVFTWELHPFTVAFIRGAAAQ